MDTQRNRHSVDVDVLDEVVFRGVGTGSAAVCPPAKQSVNESWIQSVKSIRRAGGGNREASLVRFAPVLDASNRQRAPRREGASSIDRSIALSAVDVSSTNQPAVNPMYYDSMNEGSMIPDLRSSNNPQARSLLRSFVYGRADLDFAHLDRSASHAASRSLSRGANKLKED